MTHVDSVAHEARPATDHIVPGDVRLAIAHMRANLGRQLTLAELVRACGVPGRTLQKHFRTFLGASPLAHLRRIRLGAARTALLEATPGASVTAIAARFGFSHAGRFSAEYRAQFGEPPSATLARTANDAQPDGAVACPQPAVWRYRPGLAILPFRADDGRLAHRQLGELLGEQLAAALARTHAVAVRLTPAAPADAARAALHCRTRYGLAARIASAPWGQLRIVVRLLDLEAGGVHLWGDAFDGEASDHLALLDRVVEGVARAVATGVRWAEIERSLGKPAGSQDSRDLVLRALPLVLAADATSAREALAMLEDAIGLDPDDAVPPALAAWCLIQITMYEILPDPMAERARAGQLAARAAALDSLGDPLALTARGAATMGMRRHDEAEALLARARAVDPHFGWAWERSGWARANYAEPGRAIAQLGLAMSLKGPRWTVANCVAGIGTAHLAAGRYAEAILWIDRALADNPRAVWLNRLLAPCHLALGDRSAAGAALDRLRRAFPAATVPWLLSRLPQDRDQRARLDGGFVADGPIPDGLARLGLPL